ncbi:hypothetical protein CsSME_00032715 [Camellia sinensis var. sinensis]
MEVEAAVVGNDGGGGGKDIGGDRSNGESRRRCRLRSPATTRVEAAVVNNGEDGDCRW